MFPADVLISVDTNPKNAYGQTNTDSGANNLLIYEYFPPINGDDFYNQITKMPKLERQAKKPKKPKIAMMPADKLLTMPSYDLKSNALVENFENAFPCIQAPKSLLITDWQLSVLENWAEFQEYFGVIDNTDVNPTNATVGYTAISDRRPQETKV